MNPPWKECLQVGLEIEIMGDMKNKQEESYKKKRRNYAKEYYTEI